jgi:hypothetical protein
MPERFTWSLTELCSKCSNYWQSVVRFGLPFAVLYGGINYAAFRMSVGNAGLRFPWRVETMMDAAVMFLASTIWWGLMRQLAGWKRKNQWG